MALDPKVRQRVLKALDHQEPDRVPIYEALENPGLYDYFAPDEQDWEKQAVIACHELGIDLTYGCMMPPLDEGEEILADGRVRRHAAMTVWQAQPTWRTLDDLRAWEPNPHDEKQAEDEFVRSAQRKKELYEPYTMFMPQSAGFGFVLGYDTITFTIFAEALYTAPEILRKIWNHNVQQAVERNTWFAKYKLGPAVQICEDIACNYNLMFSPYMLDEYFFPLLAEVIRPLKAAGIKVIFHSDGDITTVLPELIELGIDGINPIDNAAGMDLRAIKETYGQQLVLTGGVDGSRTLPFGTPEQVRENVKECLRIAAPGGGYLVQCSSGELMPDVPVENALAYFETVREFGKYPTDVREVPKA